LEEADKGEGFRCHLGLWELSEIFAEVLVGGGGEAGSPARLVETMVEGLDEIFGL